MRVLGDGEKWKKTDSGTLESKECTKDRDGDNREVMLQEWITTMCSADYRASLPKPSGLKLLHRLATAHSKQYSDLIQCRVERLEGQLAKEAAGEVNSDRFEQVLGNSSHQSVLLKFRTDLQSNAASTEL